MIRRKQQAVQDTVQTDSVLAAPQEAAPDSAAQGLQGSISDASDLVAEGQVQEGFNLLATNLQAILAELVPNLIGAVLVFIICYTLYRLLFGVLRRVLRQADHVRRGLETLVLQGYRLLALLSITIVVLGQLDLDIATILTGVGLAGIALSFAARDTLENIMSGVSILADASFRIGDCVIVQESYGLVEEITLRSTRVRTRRNEILVVPNKLMANEQVLNLSSAQPLRVELPFQIGYDEKPDEAREVVLALTDGDDRLRDDTTARVVVTGLGDSGVNMNLWLHPKDPLMERELTYDYSERILLALRNAGIEIPYPHVHLKVDQART